MHFQLRIFSAPDGFMGCKPRSVCSCTRYFLILSPELPGALRILSPEIAKEAELQIEKGTCPARIWRHKLDFNAALSLPSTDAGAHTNFERSPTPEGARPPSHTHFSAPRLAQGGAD